MPTASLVSLDDIRRGPRAAEGVARRTPVLPLSPDPGWRHLWSSAKTCRSTGAFKLRGAYNLISQLRARLARRAAS